MKSNKSHQPLIISLTTLCWLAIANLVAFGQPANPGGIPVDRIPPDEALTEIKHSTLENRAKAFELVSKAYDLEGGSAFENIDNFYMEIDHWIYSERNAVRHDNQAWKEKPSFEHLFEFWDFKNNRFWEAYTIQSPGGYQFASETIFANDTDYTIFPTRQSYRMSPLLSDPYHGVQAHPYHAWLDIIPARLMMLMKKQPYSLTYLGEEEINSQLVDVVEFSWPSSTKRPRFYFLKSNGQVFAVSSNHANSFDGDLTNMVFFRGRQEKEGFTLPEENIVHFDKNNILHRRIADFGIAANVDDNLFEVDDSFELIEKRWNPVTLTESVKGYSDLVQFFIENSYYIELDNFVVAFDAPRHPAITRNLIRLIKEETNKPVSYVIVSHAHQAHMAGLRPYMKEGATLVTTQNTLPLIDQIASSPSSTFGGPVFGSPVENFRVEYVDAKKSLVIKDGKREVEIINIGNTPHAEGNLIAYFKEENILLQGGLYSLEGEFSSTNTYFLNWLKKKKLENTLIAGMQHSPLIAKDLKKSKLDMPATLNIFKNKIDQIRTK